MGSIKFHISKNKGVWRARISSWPFCIKLSPDKAAELVRDAWQELVEPIQNGFRDTEKQERGNIDLSITTSSRGGSVEMLGSFDIALSANEVAEMVHDAWQEIIVPIQGNFID